MLPPRLSAAPEALCAEPGDCLAVREVLARIGDKWTLLVVGQLAEGPRRFNELRRAVDGVSQRMLTLTLRGLERDGLVRRTVEASVPPRVDYALTPAGRTLLDPVRGLVAWAEAHRTAITTARQAFDAGEVGRQAPALPSEDAA